MVNSSNGLSPLDQIRLVESELTRQVTSARVVAEHSLEKARSQAEQKKKEAFETGSREGKALTREIVAQAEEEARSITAQGQQQSTQIKNKGRQWMQTAVQFAVDFVIGLEGQEPNP